MQPIKHSTTATNQSSNQSTNKVSSKINHNNQSTSQTTKNAQQPINQWIKHPISHSANQPIEQPSRPSNQSTNPSIHQSIKWSKLARHDSAEPYAIDRRTYIKDRWCPRLEPACLLTQSYTCSMNKTWVEVTWGDFVLAKPHNTPLISGEGHWY